MDIVETFGKAVSSASRQHPQAAQRLLLYGWRAQDWKNKVAQDKRLSPSAAFLSHLMMNAMCRPLENPQNAAIVSIFTPCELLHTLGLNPYNPEGFSCYLSASHAEAPFINETEAAGIPETFCSYHKIFIGAAGQGVMPRPRCIVSTNLACDANQLTFRHLAKVFDVPHFKIDVPITPDEGSVAYVARQLRELARFLEGVTGQKLDEERLRATLAKSRQTLDDLSYVQKMRANKQILQDLVTPMYEFVTVNILLGSEPARQYAHQARQEVEEAPAAAGNRIFWMHTIPYWTASVKALLAFNPAVQIVGTDMVTASFVDFDPEDPYDAMARRMVYNALNGQIERRIREGLSWAKTVNAQGAVWFNHWGCKHTLGGAQLAKKRFEAEGLPLLILDGDGVDRSRGGEGQTTTRLEAFLEMLRSGSAAGGGN